MAYSDEQKLRFQTMPANKASYDTVSFENDNASPMHILVSGQNGPYKNKTFTIDSVETEFIPAACKIPQVTDQSDDNSLGTISFGRVGSYAFQFLDEINENAATPKQTVIKVTMRRWEQDIATPIFERVCYVNSSGVSIGPESVSVQLAVDNPALVQAVPFYDPIEYPGMAYSDQTA